MVRRDEVEWIRDSLTAAAGYLARRGDIGQRVARARERIVWMTRQHMPTRGATAALTRIKAELDQLEALPPAKAADLVPLRTAIDEMLSLIGDCLRHWRGGA